MNGKCFLEAPGISDVKSWIRSGSIKYDSDCYKVTFPDGAQIGGILADNIDVLAKKITDCLYRADFSTNLGLLRS